MMQDDAIVLEQIEVGESDLILSLLCRNRGKISVIAKGARRSKKRFMNKLEPFTLLSIEYSQKKGRLAFLHEAALHTIFPRLRTNYSAYIAASLFIELIRFGTQEEDSNPDLFALMLWALEQLNQNSANNNSNNTVTIAVFFLLHYLIYLGYRPELYRCVSCSEEVVASKQYTFENHRGGLLCSRCCHNNRTTISIATIKTLQTAQNMPLNRLKTLHFDRDHYRQKALTMLYGFNRHLLQRDCNSWSAFMTMY